MGGGGCGKREKKREREAQMIRKKSLSLSACWNPELIGLHFVDAKMKQ